MSEGPGIHKVRPVRPPPPYVPGVIVCHEKHGDRYFHAPDVETRNKVALSIVRGRMEDGYWYGYGEPEAPKTEVTQADVDGLRPDTELRKIAEGKLRTYNGELRHYTREKENYARLLKALEQNDGAAAWRHLQDCSDGEYQRVTLERYETL